ncbi:MAG: hypothetical protein H0V45_13515 [Actinobacteria bacterium]|nr:hypothetical protein [Actinomycetota bacterium]
MAAAVVLLPGAASAAPARPAIWFAPLPPLQTNQFRPYVGSTDFVQLFGKKAAWPNERDSCGNALAELEAFRAFPKGIAERCDEPDTPVSGIRSAASGS